MDGSSTRLYNVLMGNPSANNAIGRTTGMQIANQGNPNFFQKRWNSIENALGTTLAAPAAWVYDNMENAGTQNMLDRHKNSLNDIYKKYGYDNADAYYNAKDATENEVFGRYGYNANDFWDKRAAADLSGKDDEIARLEQERRDVIARMSADDAARINQFDAIQDELKGQARTNADEATNRAKAYEDYRKNNYVSQKINQDRGKFAGSAINTLSTAVDISGLGANPLANAIQGGVEGVADELEQSGFENFDANRAAQNAAIGAATGAVTGALNKGISNSLAKNGGNLFRGGNALTRGLNDLGSKTALGRVGSTLATGAARGAVSGAVGGATGAGLSSALNGVDFGQGVQNALQGAVQGAQQGAVTGGIMAGANMAISKTPGVGKFYNELQSARSNWDRSGSNFDERLTNTLTSGDSAVGDWLMNKRQSNVLGAVGNLGNRIQDVSDTYRTVDALGNRREYTPDQVRQLIDEYENYKAPDVLSGNSTDEVTDAMGEAGVTLSEIFRNRNGGQFNPYSRADGEAFNEWVQQTKADLGTPTTAKGWLKRAGERIAEDANNRGVGLSLKDVSGETAQLPTAQADSWDRLAKQYGYNDYDEVIQSYIDANPGVELNPNGAAGQILTWLDQNQNAPTTAGGWLKRAGERIVEDANNRGVGMSIKDVSEETSNDIIRTNKTSAEGKLRNAAGLKLQKQYGTIDKPTAKATNAPETLQKIAEAGFTKPADVERMSDVITGSNGEVSKLVSNLVETAKPVNTFDGETSGQTLDDYIDLAIQKRGLDGINEGKAVKSQINALMRSLPSHADGSIDFTDAPKDVFKMTQLLDAEAANYEGRSGMNYGTTNPDKLRAAQVIKDVSTLLKDRVYETVDVNKALTPEVAQNLKAYAPNNKDWANYVDNEIMTATNVKDLRSAQAPWVRAKKIIDNGYMNSVTYGGRNGGNNIIPSSKRGLVGAVLNATVNSKPALRAQAKVLNTAADIANKVSTNANTDSSAPAPTPVPTPTAPTTGVIEAEYNPATQIYNAIGRTEGLTNGEQARTANYLSNAVQEANNMPLAPNAGATTLESIVSPTANTGATSVYNSVYGTPATATMATSAPTTGYFQPTGDYWTDILANAVSAAIDANDATAFASLYGMYQDAVSKNQSNSTSQQKLSSTQQRANAAMNSLERLSGMTPDFAYNLSNIPVIGNIATWGGNDYEAEAKSLAQQIGYMVSGSNIKDSEAESIGKSYVPQPWDNDTVRKNKLRRAYEIIQQYQNGYAE